MQRQKWNQTHLSLVLPTSPFESLTSWTLYKMLIPRVMNGLEKSMTFSRSEVMVKAATARSAFCRVERTRLELVAELKQESPVVK